MRVVECADKKIRFETRDEADKSVLNEIFKFREYRAAEEIIKKAKVIIDAGAHAGFFALYCRALNPAAAIYCLEPEPDNLAQLGKHFALNGVENIFIERAALADKTGEAEFYLSADTHNHSLLKIAGARKIKVKTFSLADFCLKHKIRRVDLLKMDIEGAEEFVIDDLQNWPDVRTLLFEYHGSTVKLAEKLRQDGYGAQVFPSRFDKNFGIIFANNKKI